MVRCKCRPTPPYKPPYQTNIQAKPCIDPSPMGRFHAAPHAGRERILTMQVLRWTEQSTNFDIETPVHWNPGAYILHIEVHVPLCWMLYREWFCTRSKFALDQKRLQQPKEPWTDIDILREIYAFTEVTPKPDWGPYVSQSNKHLKVVNTPRYIAR